jgi:hypothetical protein
MLRIVSRISFTLKNRIRSVSRYYIISFPEKSTKPFPLMPICPILPARIPE